jgi:hypothetical protein
MKPKKSVFFEGVSPVVTPATAKTRAEMEDENPVRGVAWSPDYHQWRAYLHIGNRQVFHCLRPTKEAAIEARRAAEKRFSNPSIPKAIADMPGAFKRFNRGPKLERRRQVFNRVTKLSLGISTMISTAVSVKDLVCILTTKDRHAVGEMVGRLLVSLQYLSLTGDLLINDIEAGMRAETEDLKKMA